MEIAKNTDAVVIVTSKWRHLSGIERFVGPSDNAGVTGDESSSLQVQILDADDARGLWFELNSGQKKWPDRPTQKLMVPWPYVLAIVLQPDLEPKPSTIGFPAPPEALSDTPISPNDKFGV